MGRLTSITANQQEVLNEELIKSAINPLPTGNMRADSSNHRVLDIASEGAIEQPSRLPSRASLRHGGDGEDDEEKKSGTDGKRRGEILAEDSVERDSNDNNPINEDEEEDGDRVSPTINIEVASAEESNR